MPHLTPQWEYLQANCRDAARTGDAESLGKWMRALPRRLLREGDGVKVESAVSVLIAISDPFRPSPSDDFLAPAVAACAADGSVVLMRVVKRDAGEPDSFALEHDPPRDRGRISDFDADSDSIVSAFLERAPFPYSVVLTMVVERAGESARGPEHRLVRAQLHRDGNTHWRWSEDHWSSVPARIPETSWLSHGLFTVSEEGQDRLAALDYTAAQLFGGDDLTGRLRPEFGEVAVGAFDGESLTLMSQGGLVQSIGALEPRATADSRTVEGAERQLSLPLHSQAEAEVLRLRGSPLDASFHQAGGRAADLLVLTSGLRVQCLRKLPNGQNGWRHAWEHACDAASDRLTTVRTSRRQSLAVIAHRDGMVGLWRVRDAVDASDESEQIAASLSAALETAGAAERGSRGAPAWPLAAATLVLSVLRGAPHPQLNAWFAAADTESRAALATSTALRLLDEVLAGSGADTDAADRTDSIPQLAVLDDGASEAQRPDGGSVGGFWERLGAYYPDLPLAAREVVDHRALLMPRPPEWIEARVARRLPDVANDPMSADRGSASVSLLAEAVSVVGRQRHDDDAPTLCERAGDEVLVAGLSARGATRLAVTPSATGVGGRAAEQTAPLPSALGPEPARPQHPGRTVAVRALRGWLSGAVDGSIWREFAAESAATDGRGARLIFAPPQWGRCIALVSDRVGSDLESEADARYPDAESGDGSPGAPLSPNEVLYGAWVSRQRAVIAALLPFRGAVRVGPDNVHAIPGRFATASIASARGSQFIALGHHQRPSLSILRLGPNHTPSARSAPGAPIAIPLPGTVSALAAVPASADGPLFAVGLDSGLLLTVCAVTGRVLWVADCSGRIESIAVTTGGASARYLALAAPWIARVFDEAGQPLVSTVTLSRTSAVAWGRSAREFLAAAPSVLVTYQLRDPDAARSLSLSDAEPADGAEREFREFQEVSAAATLEDPGPIVEFEARVVDPRIRALAWEDLARLGALSKVVPDVCAEFAKHGDRGQKLRRLLHTAATHGDVAALRNTTAHLIDALERLQKRDGAEDMRRTTASTLGVSLGALLRLDSAEAVTWVETLFPAVREQGAVASPFFAVQESLCIVAAEASEVGLRADVALDDEQRSLLRAALVARVLTSSRPALAPRLATVRSDTVSRPLASALETAAVALEHALRAEFSARTVRALGRSLVALSKLLATSTEVGASAFLARALSAPPITDDAAQKWVERLAVERPPAGAELVPLLRELATVGVLLREFSALDDSALAETQLDRIRRTEAAFDQLIESLSPGLLRHVAQTAARVLEQRVERLQRQCRALVVDAEYRQERSGRRKLTASLRCDAVRLFHNVRVEVRVAGSVAPASVFERTEWGPSLPPLAIAIEEAGLNAPAAAEITTRVTSAGRVLGTAFLSVPLKGVPAPAGWLAESPTYVDLLAVSLAPATKRGDIVSLSIIADRPVPGDALGEAIRRARDRGQAIEVVPLDDHATVQAAAREGAEAVLTAAVDALEAAAKRAPVVVAYPCGGTLGAIPTKAFVERLQSGVGKRSKIVLAATFTTLAPLVDQSGTTVVRTEFTTQRDEAWTRLAIAKGVAEASVRNASMACRFDVRDVERLVAAPSDERRALDDDLAVVPARVLVALVALLDADTRVPVGLLEAGMVVSADVSGGNRGKVVLRSGETIADWKVVSKLNPDVEIKEVRCAGRSAALVHLLTPPPSIVVKQAREFADESAFEVAVQYGMALSRGGLIGLAPAVAHRVRAHVEGARELWGAIVSMSRAKAGLFAAVPFERWQHVEPLALARGVDSSEEAKAYRTSLALCMSEPRVPIEHVERVTRAWVGAPAQRLTIGKLATLGSAFELEHLQGFAPGDSAALEVRLVHVPGGAVRREPYWPALATQNVLWCLWGPGVESLSAPARGSRVLALRANWLQDTAVSDVSRVHDLFAARIRRHRGLRALSPFQTGLGLPPGSPVFVGREQEVVALVERVRHENVLLIGARQVGKTSLANQVWGRLRDDGSYDVWYADLQGFVTWDDVPAGAVGAAGERGPAVGWSRWLTALRERAHAAGRTPILILNEVDFFAEREPLSAVPAELAGAADNSADQSSLAPPIGGLALLRRFAEDPVSPVRVLAVGYALLDRWLRQPGHPFYHLFGHTTVLGQTVKPLGKPAVAQLLEILDRPALSLTWWYAGLAMAERERRRKHVVDIVFAATAGFPLETQRVCAAIVDRLDRESREQIELDDVKAACDGVDLVARYDQLDFDRMPGASHRPGVTGPLMRALLAALVEQLYPPRETFDPNDIDAFARAAGSGAEFTPHGAQDRLLQRARAATLPAEHEAIERAVRDIDLPRIARSLELTHLWSRREPRGAAEGDTERKYIFTEHIYPFALRRSGGIEGRFVSALIDLLAALRVAR